jgi:hypothetical protein
VDQDRRRDPRHHRHLLPTNQQFRTLDGQCEFDLLLTDERADYQQAATTKGQGWQIPPPVPEPLPRELDAKLR